RARGARPPQAGPAGGGAEHRRGSERQAADADAAGRHRPRRRLRADSLPADAEGYRRVKMERRQFLHLAGVLAACWALPLRALAQAAASPLKIGIIGSGRLGGTVGSLWAKAGHQVMFSGLDVD